MLRIKVISALLAISFFFLYLFFGQFENQMFVDKIEQIQSGARNQVASLAAAYEADSRFLVKWAGTLEQEGTRKINWTIMTPYFAVAHLNADYQVVEWSFRDPSPISGLTKEALTQLVSSFHVEPTQKQVNFHFFQDQDKKRVLLTLVPYNSKLWVFASLGENLQALMDGQKTQSQNLTLINKDLVSLAHVKAEYVGQKMFQNSIIKDVLETNRSQASGVYKLQNGEEFFSAIEKIPNVEAFIYTQSSMADLIASKNEFRNQFWLFSFGFLFLIVGIVFLLVPNNLPRNSTGRRSTDAPVVIDSNLKTSMKETQIEAPVASLSDERTQSFMKMAAALGHEMKAPIIKILNQIQTFNFAEGSESKMQEIKQDVRSANETIDKLLLFAGEKQQDKIETKIDTALLRALKNCDLLVNSKKVKVIKEFDMTPLVSIDVNQMAVVFENLIKNSIQALERKADKVIKIKSQLSKNKVIVSIEDNGEGISEDIQGKIFDPFFTTYGVETHLGLGLSTALGIVKQHEGEIKIRSEKSKGASFSVSLPLASEKSISVESSHKVALPVVKIDLENLKAVQHVESKSVSESPDVKNEAVLISDQTGVHKQVLDLNLNVDELFDDEKIADEGTQNGKEAESRKSKIDLSHNHKPDVDPIAIPDKELNLKPSDRFSVQIRKPRRSI